MWKEELGPVGREHREAIWERFKVATKTINDKRQVYYKEIDKVYEKNLEHKLEIILKIEQIAIQENSSHGALQNKIKEVEVLRDAFFNAGKVPIKVNEATWAKFKESVRLFNRKKNVFYKDLKKDQYKNLQLKLDLIKIAEDNKESDDFESVTPLMKKIQGDWKKIGHVPRKDSDKIWKRFKAACNQYFDRIHAKRNAASEEQVEAYNKKNEFLNSIKKELQSAEDNTSIKQVIKIIDRNLNNTDDWNVFEEAFNNADKDFLKKVKSIHPALTSNDLRLCAYLRLNLSSKEIAPLLNISARSVEVKRYRLRKKMDLAHESNLTDYILEI